MERTSANFTNYLIKTAVWHKIVFEHININLFLTKSVFAGKRNKNINRRKTNSGNSLSFESKKVTAPAKQAGGENDEHSHNHNKHLYLQQNNPNVRKTTIKLNGRKCNSLNG